MQKALAHVGGKLVSLERLASKLVSFMLGLLTLGRLAGMSVSFLLALLALERLASKLMSFLLGLLAVTSLRQTKDGKMSFATKV